MSPRPQRSTFQVKTFSFNEKETSDDHGRREQAYKRALDLKRSNFQVKTFSLSKKETSYGRKRREQAHQDLPSTLKAELSSQTSRLLSRNSTFLKTKIKSKDLSFVCLQKILEIVPKFFYINTNFICSHFCDYKFWHARWDVFTYHFLFPKVNTSKSKQHILQRSYGHQKQISLAKILSSSHHQ